MPQKPPHPGETVLRLIERHNLTLTAAAAVGVTRPGFSDLVNGKRGVSPEMAVRLSKVSGDRTAEDWMMQQVRYEVAQVPAHRLRLKRLEANRQTPSVKGYDGSENTENPAMQLNVPPDLETLINKRLSSGGYTNAEDVLRRALEAQDAEESCTDEERRAVSAHIEEGYLQAERGELIDRTQARSEIQAMKDDWRLSKR